MRPLLYKSFLFSCVLHGALFAAIWSSWRTPRPPRAQNGVFVLPVEMADAAAPAARRPIARLSAPEDQAATGAVPSAAEGPVAPVVENVAMDSGTANARYVQELVGILARHKEYPAAARKAGEEGGLELAFRISRDGSVSQLRLTKPSRYARLNRAALEIFEEIGRFPPLPQGMTENYLDLKLPLEYSLD